MESLRIGTRRGSVAASRARDIIRQRLSLGIGRDAEFTFQDFGAGPVLPQRFRPPPGTRVGANQRALPNFRERVKTCETTRRLNRRIVLTCLVLQGGQALQDSADKIERAVSFRREPFLERLGIDYEIGEKFAPVQFGSHH